MNTIDEAIKLMDGCSLAYSLDDETRLMIVRSSYVYIPHSIIDLLLSNCHDFVVYRVCKG